MSNPQDFVKGILEHIEPDQKNGLREGLKNTPKRVVESWDEIYSGYNQDPKKILDATFIFSKLSGCDPLILELLTINSKSLPIIIPTNRTIDVVPINPIRASNKIVNNIAATVTGIKNSEKSS